MPTPAYVTFSDIKGSIKIEGREGTSEVIEFHHDLHIPVDPKTGTLTGIRVHGPVVLMKPFDSASPDLYEACCKGKTIKQVQITWYAIDDSGKEVAYFLHKLEKVKVAGIKATMPNTKDPEKERYVHLEEVSLMYEKIEWEYVDGNLVFVDTILKKG